MDQIEVKKILKQYRDAIRMVRFLDKKIEELDDRLTSIKTSRISGMPRGGRAKTKEDILSEKIKFEERRDRFRKKAVQKREQTQTYIDTVLSPKHNDLLTKHYIDDLSIEEIAEQMPCSYRHAWRIYREALGMVDVSNMSVNRQ